MEGQSCRHQAQKVWLPCCVGALLQDNSCWHENPRQEGASLPPPGCVAAAAGGHVQAACVMQQGGEAGTRTRARIQAVLNFSCPMCCRHGQICSGWPVRAAAEVLQQSKCSSFAQIYLSLCCRRRRRCSSGPG